MKCLGSVLSVTLGLVSYQVEQHSWGHEARCAGSKVNLLDKLKARKKDKEKFVMLVTSV